jgi:hypothetical protein
MVMHNTIPLAVGMQGSCKKHDSMVADIIIMHSQCQLAVTTKEH